MLVAGAPASLAELLEPQLDRLESDRRSWQADARLPDGAVLDLYLDTFDPEHPEDDPSPSADAAAEDERRARLLLRRQLEALGYGLDPDPHAPPAVRTHPWPAALTAVPVGGEAADDLRRAEAYVLAQYDRAVRAACTAAGLEPTGEAVGRPHFLFEAREPDSLRGDGPPVVFVPAPGEDGRDGVEVGWTDDRQGWFQGPYENWSGWSGDVREPLSLPLFAHPEDVAAVVRQLLAGERAIVPRPREWEHADALTTLRGQAEALERLHRERGETHW